MRTILLIAALGQLACASGEESPPAADSSGPGSGGTGGGAGAAGGETGGEAPAPYIHFTVVGAGLDEEQTWVPPTNQVQCLGASAMLLQFALDAEGAADHSRMEVSVVDYSGPATFTGADCVGAGCPPQAPGTFGLSFWPSGGSSPIYRNGSSSMPCTLDLDEPAVGSLAGSWSCQALEDVVAGGATIGMTADFACEYAAQ